MLWSNFNLNCGQGKKKKKYVEIYAKNNEKKLWYVQKVHPISVFLKFFFDIAKAKEYVVDKSSCTISYPQ